MIIPYKIDKIIMSQQPGLGARRTEIKCFKHSQNKSCITDILLFYLLIYFTFASHRKMVRDGFSFSVPTTEFTSLPSVENFIEMKKKKLPGWLDFPLLSQLYRSGSSNLFCNRGDNWTQHGHMGWKGVAGTQHHSCSGI